jgi:hypothetical protein
VPRRVDGEPDAVIELSAARALDADDLNEILEDPPRIEPGATFLLG